MARSEWRVGGTGEKHRRIQRGMRKKQTYSGIDIISFTFVWIYIIEYVNFQLCSAACCEKQLSGSVKVESSVVRHEMFSSHDEGRKIADISYFLQIFNLIR